MTITKEQLECDCHDFFGRSIACPIHGEQAINSMYGGRLECCGKLRNHAQTCKNYQPTELARLTAERDAYKAALTQISRDCTQETALRVARQALEAFKENHIEDALGMVKEN